MATTNNSNVSGTRPGRRLRRTTDDIVRAGGWASRRSDADAADPTKTYMPGIHMYAAKRAEAGEQCERDNEFYYLAFRLRDDFVESYRTRSIAWGFPIGGGNSLGEITWLTKYSRRKADGSKERFWEGCRRVIEGMYSIQKEQCLRGLTPWDEAAAHTSAQEAYERLFAGKWSPPGRGFWMMGTFFVNGLHDSSALQNCGFLSTEHIDEGDPAYPFIRLMEMSMLGVGVGFDTKGEGRLELHQPRENSDPAVIVDDSREGWYDSTGMLLRSYFLPGQRAVVFDYSEIRPTGEPIKGFGGTAAGPEPLIYLHDRLRKLLAYRKGEHLASSDIVDIMNLIGKCVVAANVRSSAEIALGRADDEEFLNLKDWNKNPERMGENGWGYTSNNSVIAKVGGNYDHLAQRIELNGEPGLFWIDMCQQYGRLADPRNDKDHRVGGVNPCGEQPLEPNELCTLVETYPTHSKSLADFLRTLKFAYLYAKTVTLLPTHWPETNEVMRRNHRIGTSMSGLAQFVEQHGWHELKQWQDAGYAELKKWDHKYSEWLGVRKSIKITTIKPAGTTSLLFGVTPGAHWPTERGRYLRRMRLTVGDAVAKAMAEAGYPVEPNVMNPQFGLVVTTPTRGPDIRSEREVSLWEKVSLAANCQAYWSDNSVSLTASFLPTEQDQVLAVMRAFDGRVKSLSFLRLQETGGAYAQMPYERVPEGEWEILFNSVKSLDWDGLYAGDADDPEGERYCTTDVCEIRPLMNNGDKSSI